jgi:hypothetical protein
MADVDIVKMSLNACFTSSKCSTRAAVRGDVELISATASETRAIANGTGLHQKINNANV